MPKDNLLQKVPSLDSYKLPKLGEVRVEAPPQREPEPYVKPPKEVAKPKEAEAFGFITNLPKSLLSMAKSIFVDLPVAVGNAAYGYAKDPSQYAKDLNLFLNHPGDTGEFLKHELTDYYSKDLWHNINDDPARFLGDAAMVMSGVGLVGKTGQLGRAAAITGRAAEAGKVGLLSNAAKTAGRSGRTLQNVGKASEYVDPLMLASKGLGKALAGPLEAFGIGEYTQDLKNMGAHLQAQEALEAAKATKENIFGKLVPADKERLRRLLIVGNPEEIAEELAKGGTVAERYNKWVDRIGSVEEPHMKQALNMMDDDMIKANAKYIETYTRETGEHIPADVAESLIRSGDLKPTYMSMYRLKNQSLDLFDAMNDSTGRQSVLSRLQKRLGGGEYLKDVDEVMARQIHSFHVAKYKLALLRGTKELMLSRGKLLIAHTPQEIDSAIAQGYRPLKDAFYNKYWSSFSKATAAQLESLVQAGKTGRNQAEALRAVQEKLKSLDSLGEDLKDAGQIFVPAHVAAFLNQELAPVGKLAQTYDKWVSRYKSMATVFNPRYWAPVAIGNAALGVLYGLSPDMIKLALKYKGDLPPLLKELMNHEIYLKDMGIYDRTAKSLGDAASRLDMFFKKGIFAQEVAKEAYGRMKTGIFDFFPAQATIEDAIKFYAAAPQRYYGTIEELSKIRGMAAEGLLSKDKEAVRLKRLEKRLTNEMARLMEFKAVNLKELEAIIESRKDRLASALGYADKGKNWGDAVTIRYAPLAQDFTSAMKELTIALKKRPELVDSAAVAQSIDSAIRSVEAGHPEWLRHSVKRLREAIRGKSPMMQRRSRLTVIQDMVGKSEELLAAKTADLMAKLASSGQLLRRIPSLARDAQVAERAIAVGNKFYGSYHDLLPFEKNVIKRIIPFYTFTKAMTSLAFRFPFLYPKRAFIYSHLARAWNDIMTDDNAFMPSWTKNYIPVGAMEDGSVMMMRVGSLGPMGNVRMGHFGEMGIPSIMDITQSNPLIRLAFEMKGGIPEWSARPLSPGNRSVRLDNGEVIEWTGTGFRKIIAQPNVLKSIAYLLPQAQLIDSLLRPYAQTDRGWLFDPQPITGPDGKPRFPKALVDRLMSFAVPTTRANPDILKQRSRVELARVVKEYQQEIRSASPERRQALIESLRSYAKSQRHAMERD